METSPLPVNKFVVTTLKRARGPGIPDGQVMRTVGPPTVGRRMTLFGPQGLRVTTTPVVDVISDEGFGTCVVTQNSAYFFEPIELFVPPCRRTTA